MQLEFRKITLLGHALPANGHSGRMTEKCRTGPRLEPRVFRLTYERSTS